jgi:hypothetical protein
MNKTTPNMTIKTGCDDELKDLTWYIEPGMRVFAENEQEETVVSIDPEDFLAIADAIRGMQKREIENEKLRQ